MTINNISASSPPVVRLLGYLVLSYLQLNVFLYAVHIPGSTNKLADVLSHFQWDVFRALAPEATQVGVPCPLWLWNAGLIQDSLSAGTWVAYNKVWLEWFALLEEVGGVAEEEKMSSLVLIFVCSNLEKGVSEARMSRKLAALLFLFKLSGEKDFTKSFMIQQVLLENFRRHVFFGL